MIWTRTREERSKQRYKSRGQKGKREEEVLDTGRQLEGKDGRIYLEMSPIVHCMNLSNCSSVLGKEYLSEELLMRILFRSF